MTQEERQTIIENSAANGNVIIATITQNLIDTYYDDRFIDDYLFSLTKTKIITTEDMSEVLGCSVYDFYIKYKSSFDVKLPKSTIWEEIMSQLVKDEIHILLNKISK